MISATLSQSGRKNKRLKVVVRDYIRKKTIHFGAKDGQTYIDHKNDEKRDNWIARHSEINTDWEDPFTAGFWSRWVLWEKKSLSAALKNVVKKHKIDLTID
jgi:hypothetical protein